MALVKTLPEVDKPSDATLVGDGTKFTEDGFAKNIGLTPRSLIAAGRPFVNGLLLQLNEPVIRSTFLEAPGATKARALLDLSADDAKALDELHAHFLPLMSAKFEGKTLEMKAPHVNGELRIGFPSRGGSKVNIISGEGFADQFTLDQANEALRGSHPKRIDGNMNVWALKDKNDANKVIAGYYFTARTLQF